MIAPTYVEWLYWAGEFGLIGLVVPVCGFLASWLFRDALVQQGILRGVFVLVMFLSLGEAVGSFRDAGGREPESIRSDSWQVSFPLKEPGPSTVAEEITSPSEVEVAGTTINGAQEVSWLETRSWLPGLLLLAGFCGGLTYFLILRIGLQLYLSRHRAPVSRHWRERFLLVKQKMNYQGSCRLWRSSGRLGPFVVGFLRPIVLMPDRQMEGFSVREWELVLAHEVAHLKNRDGLWLPFVNLITLLFWWHPVLWLAKQRLQQVGEFAADSRAIAASYDRNSLAACLIKFGRILKLRGSAGGLLTRGLAFQSELARRVHRLMEGGDYRLPLENRGRFWRVSLCVLLTLSLYFGVFRALSPNLSAGVPFVDRMVAGLARNVELPEEQPTGETNAPLIPVEAVASHAELEISPEIAPEELPEELLPASPPASSEETIEPVVEVKPPDAEPARVIRRYRINATDAERLIRKGSGAAVNQVIAEEGTIQQLLLAFFEDMGVRFAPAESDRGESAVGEGSEGAPFFYDDQRGLLLVRTTEAELATIEEAATFLASTPEQVAITVKIVELEGEAAQLIEQRSDLRGAIGSESAHEGATVILDEEAYQDLIKTLESTRGASVLSAPRMTTLSGRQAEVSAMQRQSVVFPASYQPAAEQEAILEPIAKGAGGELAEGEGYLVQDVRVGPIVRVLPSVRVAQQLIDLNVSFIVREFLGYDDPGPIAVNGELQRAGGKSGPLPLPRFRDRAASGSAVLRDGQSLVLRGMTTTDITKMKSKIPLLGDLPLVGQLFRREKVDEKNVHLLVFVTPIVIDPAGNRRFGP